jgi:hypothetical protein
MHGFMVIMYDKIDRRQSGILGAAITPLVRKQDRVKLSRHSGRMQMPLQKPNESRHGLSGSHVDEFS